MVPIGERALRWIRRYVDAVRSKLVQEPDEGVLFLASMGGEFAESRMTALVRRYVERAALGKSGSSHLFRHTMATLMHENGADIGFIEVIPGHVKLDTTQIHTQVSIRALKEIHTATHPAKDSRSLAADENDHDEIDQEG